MILSVHGGHNASAAVVGEKNGSLIIRCIEAERIDRIKMSCGCDYYSGDDFSSEAKGKWIKEHKSDLSFLIGTVLKASCCTVEDLDCLVLSQNVDETRLPNYLSGINIVRISHHLSHAALSYYTSDFDEALIIVCDGSGEKTPEGYEIQSAWYGKDNCISNLHSTSKKSTYDSGIGNAYEIFTYWLDYGYNGCGTTMALASFKDKFQSNSDKIFTLNENGDIFVNKDFFDLHQHVESTKYVKEGTAAYNKTHEDMIRSVKLPTGYKLRKRPENSVQDVFVHMANDIQKATENAVLKFIDFSIDHCNDFKGNVCMGGGTFLNCNLNSKIRNMSRVTDIHVPTAPGDGGLALGAALYYYFSDKPKCKIGSTAFIGNEIDSPLINSDIISCKKMGVEIYNIAAKLIAKGNLVGWCQGKSEFGPRALGHRSLLADPGNMKSPERINRMLKHREAFRPFAPAVLESEYSKIFEMPYPIEYMLETRIIKEKWRSIIPAVCHIDNSARVQVVNEENCKEFYRLLSEFFKITDIPVLLNTSLNRNGEPIVDKFEDAIELLKRNMMDYLVVNDTIYYLKGKDFDKELR